MTTRRKPTETEKKLCPLCRDGYPILDGTLHDALGFGWRCQATVMDATIVAQLREFNAA